MADKDDIKQGKEFHVDTPQENKAFFLKGSGKIALVEYYGDLTSKPPVPQDGPFESIWKSPRMKSKSEVMRPARPTVRSVKNTKYCNKSNAATKCSTHNGRKKYQHMCRTCMM